MGNRRPLYYTFGSFLSDCVMAEKSAPAKRPRTSVSVTVKKKICTYKHHHPKATQEEIRAITIKEDGLEIGRSTISDILRESKKWFSAEDSSSTNKKEGRYVQLEEALWIWFGNIRSRNIAISDEMLRVKAKEFGETMGISELTYSSGWLQGFKKRHGIRVKVIHGEAASVDTDIVEEGRRKLKEFLSKYAPSNIYNMDETGLFFRLEPNRTLATGSVYGTKKSKERISVALCANSDGTDKLQRLVIGKAARPRCFPKTFNVQSVVQYYHNSKAWMTSTIFVDWLKRLERQMSAQKRYIVLLLDNAPSHIHNLELTHVHVEMLPPNTTAHIQPMDAGIIKNFKLHYKRKLLQHYVSQVDEKGAFSRIDIKQAIYFVKDSWELVKKETIANCFSHVQIRPADIPGPLTTGSQEQEVTQELEGLISSAHIENPLTVDEYLAIGGKDITEKPLTDEDIIRLVQGEPPDTSDHESDEEEDHPQPTYTLTESIQVCERLLSTLEKHDGFFEEDYGSLRNLIGKISMIRSRETKQTSITDFFAAP